MTLSGRLQPIGPIVALAALLSWALSACGTSVPSDVFRVQAPQIAQAHVDVVDGTGTPAAIDQTIVIDSGRIAAIGPACTTISFVQPLEAENR